MKLLGIPDGGNTRVHKSGCRDISKDPAAKGKGYDDVYHIDASSKLDAVQKLPKGNVIFVGCTKTLKAR
jgi:hypothetical protein